MDNIKPLQLTADQLTRKQHSFLKAHPRSRAYPGTTEGSVFVYQYHPETITRFILDKDGQPLSENHFASGEADQRTYEAFTDGLTQSLDAIWEMPTYDGPR